ncbi:MAG: transketolase C-terminal domain-containing protein [Candidatus Velthaea sp.]|jgi:transketolase
MRKAAINAVYALAKRDPRVVFIGSDLGAGVLDEMRTSMPERFFMEGVSEAHVIGMAAGLGMNGYVPYINTIATFLTRRCYEQIAIDLCLHDIPARLIASGAGTVYAPLGPTHMAVEDIAILRALPNMAIVAPVDAAEMTRLMDASLDWPGPLYIRVAKGGDPVVSRPDLPFAIGKAIRLREPGEVLFVSTGIATTRALAAAERLAQAGVTGGVLHMHTIKPLDVAELLAAAGDAELVVTVEEHTRIGGLGSAVAETFADEGIAQPLLRLGLPDAFSHDYGNQDHVLNLAGLSPAAIAAGVLARLARRPVGVR